MPPKKKEIDLYQLSKDINSIKNSLHKNNEDTTINFNELLVTIETLQEEVEAIKKITNDCPICKKEIETLKQLHADCQAKKDVSVLMEERKRKQIFWDICIKIYLAIKSFLETWGVAITVGAGMYALYQYFKK